MTSKVEDFVRNWNGRQEAGIGERVKNAFKPKQPLKYKLVTSNYKLRTTINRLEVYISKMQERDRVLFERVISAQMAKDNARASMYANEIAEIRKMTKQIIGVQIALEQVQLRLETVTEVADVFNNLIPVIGVVRELKNAIKGVMPEISMELADVEEGLQEVVIEAGDFTGTSIEQAATSPEARKILQEASMIAEQRMKENFPDLPALVTTTQKAENGNGAK
ncbi:Cell division protein B2 [Metallosphaera sp. J1]|uniref:cell division protein CdvB1/B2 n=1 Tax=Metallosphaera javensis (ex Hofmann et al. 2022) TaxID=99938 RepID=UPI001EE0A591|nr:cell division protein CdvB1/B2 [Metallosphaera javensis (ex Hofmann et al. 2022)]MCG3108854.1 Cell division protein B2 [Metallosphaera javensis (ex Hofmann et al. 2022)]